MHDNRTTTADLLKGLKASVEAMQTSAELRAEHEREALLVEEGEPAGERVDGHEPDVVPALVMDATGVAEAHDDPGRLVQL